MEQDLVVGIVTLKISKKERQNAHSSALNVVRSRSIVQRVFVIAVMGKSIVVDPKIKNVMQYKNEDIVRKKARLIENGNDDVIELQNGKRGKRNIGKNIMQKTERNLSLINANGEQIKRIRPHKLSTRLIAGAESVIFLLL